MTDQQQTWTSSTEVTVNSYVYLFFTATNALERAKKTEEGQLYELLTVNMFAAFTFEAYLNHVGAQKLKYWDIIERKLGTEEKLKLFEAELQLEINYSQGDFQQLNPLIKFRNQVAHGKTFTEIVEKTHKVKCDEKPPISDSAGWLNSCKKTEDSERFLNSVHQMIIYIHSIAFPEESSDSVFGSLATSSGGYSSGSTDNKAK